ncbi:MAG: MYXO-CTERM sorting domain-containing protein [Myxococcota bacterium]
MHVARCLKALGALTLCALALPASAFAPSEHGHDNAEPNRIYQFSPLTQVELRSTPEWQDFLANEGQGWTIRFDEQTGAPLTMYGRGLDVGSIETEAQAVAAVRSFLGRHADLLRVSPKTFSVGTAGYSGDMDTWYVDIPVTYEGTTVWRGGVTARIKHDRLVLVGVQAYTDTPRVGDLVLSQAEAIQTAIDLGPAPDSVHTDASAELVWLPYEFRGELSLVRTWRVRANTEAPLGEWVHFVDAETGELLNTHNEIRFIDGQIRAQVYPRVIGEARVNSPMVQVRVSGDGQRTETDGNGNFSLDARTATVELTGSDLVVRDASNGNNIPGMTFTTEDLVITESNITLPALTTWVALQRSQDFMGAVAPEVVVGGRNGSPLTSNINVGGGTCNAFYSSQAGTVNFYLAGGGCNNTGLIADVNYHEWGHGFHAFSLQGGSFDGSLSEGVGDIISFLQTDDRIIGPTFRNNGSGIRDVGPNRVYPQDYREGSVHANGTIFGGAMWDLVAELEPRYGREEANRVTAGLLAGAIKSGPAIATIGEEILVADDDDGDLSNGTPHYCEITAAFGLHGLLPQAGVSALLTHEQVVEADPVSPVVIDALISGASDLPCIDFGDVQIIYRADGGDWAQVPMDSSSDTINGTLPDLPYGTFVEYYLSADQGGSPVTVPAGGFTNPLSLYVGGVLDVYSNDFESDDGGFTSELLDGEVRDGADDWQYGTPNGRGGDPLGAYSGTNAWGNDLGNDIDGQAWNGQYQNEKHNRLTTPELAVPEHLEGVFLRYARWLNMEDGTFDKGQILADGEVVWSNYASGDTDGGFHHSDTRWVVHSVDLNDATQDGGVTLAWEIITDQGLALGGWTIDDVNLYAPATPNNRLAILDLVAGDEEEGGVTLTWTNPIYAPLEEVIVVRKAGELPTGPTDGEVIHVDEDPELGAPNSFFDETGMNKEVYYYAVYGGDGQDTLGWTVEGWNADTGSGSGQPENGISGCSCNASPTSGHLAWLGLGGLVLLWRRRRS